MKLDNAQFCEKVLKFEYLKRFFVLLLCLLMVHCSGNASAPKKEGGSGKAPIIPKINKVENKTKEDMTVVNAKATGYRSIELELSHEISQEKAAANLGVYKVEASKKDNPGAQNLKVIGVKVSAPKKLELQLSKRLLSMKYTLTITDLESDTAILKQGSKEIVPDGSRMVFISEASSNGNLKNLLPSSPLEGYQVPNVLCQAEAEKHGLLGEYKALFLHQKLLEEQNDSYHFLRTFTDYVRADGAGKVNLGRAGNDQIQASFSLPMDVMANGQLVPYTFDADGAIMQESFIAFTGFNSTYASLENDMCGDEEIWDSADDFDVTGSVFRNKLEYFIFGAKEVCNCQSQARIICLQSTSAIKEEGIAAWEAGEDGESYAGDNYMLVSSVNVSANMEEALEEQGGAAGVSGLKAADAVCSTLVKKAAEDTSNALSAAARASFKKNHMNYIAILSGQEEEEDKNAKDRFSAKAYASGSYHLPNGVKVVDKLEDFFNPKTGLLAPVAMTEQGSYIELVDAHPFGVKGPYGDRTEVEEQVKSIVEKDLLPNFVFTGSNESGEIDEAGTCESWTSSDASGMAGMGVAIDSYLRLSLQAISDYNDDVDISDLPACGKKLRLFCAYNQPK